MGGRVRPLSPRVRGPLPAHGERGDVERALGLAEFQEHGYPLPVAAAERVARLEREIDERVAGLYARAAGAEAGKRC